MGLANLRAHEANIRGSIIRFKPIKLAKTAASSSISSPRDSIRMIMCRGTNFLDLFIDMIENVLMGPEADDATRISLFNVSCNFGSSFSGVDPVGKVCETNSHIAQDMYLVLSERGRNRAVRKECLCGTRT